MHIAILTFDGFNELDSFIALGLLNRLSTQGWKAQIASPSTHVTSMNGVTIQAQQPLEFANEADAVIFGSGIYTRAIAGNACAILADECVNLSSKQFERDAFQRPHTRKRFCNGGRFEERARQDYSPDENAPQGANAFGRTRRIAGLYPYR